MPRPSATGFRGFAPGSGCDESPAQDFFAANRFNVLALVVELPRSLLAPARGRLGTVRIWTTTSVTAAYLGVESGGATGRRFGGRGLTDVVDLTLGAVFGKTLATLNLAPDDLHESQCLTTDNVGSGSHRFPPPFPYLGAPW